MSKGEDLGTTLIELLFAAALCTTLAAAAGSTARSVMQQRRASEARLAALQVLRSELDEALFEIARGRARAGTRRRVVAGRSVERRLALESDRRLWRVEIETGGAGGMALSTLQLEVRD